MNAPAPVEVVRVGLATPVGFGAASAAAAVRAGICRFAEGSYLNALHEPQRMSVVREEHLREVHDAAAAGGAPVTPRDRMLRLGALALEEACADCAEPVPLLLALPEPRPGIPDAGGADFLPALAAEAGVTVDPRSSREYRQGGAGGLFALRDAQAMIATGRALVAVGGVDSLTDPALLAALDGEGRLLGASMDGFIPGEAAAFLLLGPRGTARRLRRAPVALVAGVATGVERGHRSSAEPYLGEGLAEVFQALFRTLAETPPVRCVYAGLNGENLPVKEWGVAYLRSAERFAAELETEHPADCLGEVGAALGPAMLALAALGLAKGWNAEPCLVWSTSDGESRAAALLRAAR